MIHERVQDIVIKPLTNLLLPHVLNETMDKPIGECGPLSGRRVFRHFYVTLYKDIPQGITPQMDFTVAKPYYDTINRFYILQIDSPPVFTCEGSDLSGMVFEGALSDRFNEFVEIFLTKASSSFSKPLDKAIFLQRATHRYSTGEHDVTGVQIREISWIPVRILFYPSRYEICWTLSSFEPIVVSPGTLIQEADIDVFSSADPPRRLLSPESVQKRTRQKIRQARIRCAFAKLHLENMIERYYSRYGHFDGLSDADSELSSGAEN